MHDFYSFCCSFFLFLSYRCNAHRRPIMWFQWLCLWGTAPSGGKPLRLCWHITTPIINSRSALSFLLDLSSFLLTAAHLLLCFFHWFIHLHSPLHISFNLLSWQYSYFSSLFHYRCTALNYWYFHQRITGFSWDQPRFGLRNVQLNEKHISFCEWSGWRQFNDLTLSLRLELKHYSPRENRTVTFKLCL